MKKLAIAIAATAMIALSHAPVNAQTDEPGECAERDTATVDCEEFYVEVLPPTTPAPSTTTTTLVASQPPGGLPKTGSGVSPILGMGAAMLAGGGIIVVASRRRRTATA